MANGKQSIITGARYGKKLTDKISSRNVVVSGGTFLVGYQVRGEWRRRWRLSQLVQCITSTSFIHLLRPMTR